MRYADASKYAPTRSMHPGIAAVSQKRHHVDGYASIGANTPRPACFWPPVAGFFGQRRILVEKGISRIILPEKRHLAAGHPDQ